MEYQLSEKKAKEAVTSFVDLTKAALEKREIIVFPRVGRLYKDFENNHQFLQDNTNFNSEAFGLPSVQFYPILRQKETAEREAPMPKASVPSYGAKNQPSKLVRVLSSAMPLVAGFVLVLLGISYIFFKNEPVFVQASPQPMPVDQRINKKPYIDEVENASIISMIDRKNGLAKADAPAKIVEPEKEISRDEDGDYIAEVDTESARLGPDQNEGVIIIGTYRKKSSVQTMVDEIYELGYDVYKKKTKNGTRVGVQFIYEDRAELDKIHRRVKRKIEDRAWIYKR